MQKVFYLSVVFSLFSFVKINQPYRSGISADTVAATEISSNRFEESVRRLYDEINLSQYDLEYAIFQKGIVGYQSLRQQGKLGEKNLITIIDFTKPSTEKRFYTIDLDKKALIFHSLVAHGRNTGENLAKSFSNKEHSNQSSLGFYVTGESYVGSKGYSLRLDGQENEYNGNLRARAVVIHAADYVSEAWVKKFGRIGRSQGCPALPKEINKAVIDSIKNKTVVFAYFNDQSYLNSSAYLKSDQVIGNPEAELSITKRDAPVDSMAGVKAE
jgi:hypothetical protein